MSPSQSKVGAAIGRTELQKIYSGICSLRLNTLFGSGGIFLLLSTPAFLRLRPAVLMKVNRPSPILAPNYDPSQAMDESMQYELGNSLL
jgi:hypothetical protein